LIIGKRGIRLRAYPKILSEAPEKSGVEAFARIFPAPFRNFGICTKKDLSNAFFRVSRQRNLLSKTKKRALGKSLKPSENI
jgi:hypothetical protein